MRAVLVLGSVFVVALTLAAQTKLPEGEGKAVTQLSCNTQCHGIETVTAARKTPAQWAKVTEEMIALGAKATPAEQKLIVSYLAKHFPLTVNINSGSARQIADTLEVPIKVGIAIVQHRKSTGVFKTFEDLLQVPGIARKDIEDKKDRIVYKEEH